MDRLHHDSAADSNARAEIHRDPRTARREFTVIMPEEAVPGMLPVLLRTLSHEAPELDLHIEMIARLPIKLLQLPFEVPHTQEVLLWHERHEPDPAHTWLRELIVDIARKSRAGELAS